MANKYETDKGTEFSFAHGFTEFYEPFFEKYENPTILELGVDVGSAEKMLNAFYDENCTIYCVDIEDRKFIFDGYDNIKFFQCDLSKPENILKLISEFGDIKFDIIIDDASHQWADQFLSLDMFNSLLTKDGIYVLEDLHTSFEADVFGENKHWTESPLCFLMFDNDKYSHVFSKIESVNLYTHWNKYIGDNGHSVTSIIKFKNDC